VKVLPLNACRRRLALLWLLGVLPGFVVAAVRMVKDPHDIVAKASWS
jgi:hypothetical protein